MECKWKKEGGGRGKVPHLDLRRRRGGRREVGVSSEPKGLAEAGGELRRAERWRSAALASVALTNGGPDAADGRHQNR